MSKIYNKCSKSHWRDRNIKNAYDIKYSCYQKYFNKYLPIDNTKSCIEIGAVPGNHLIYLAKFHRFRATALDYINEVSLVADNLRFNGVNDFDIINEDFCNWKPNKKYDLVCSFGFIEHFDDYEYIIRKHMDIVADNGYLVITVPYLKYFQYWLRKIVYENSYFNHIRNIHNFEIMDLNKLETIIASAGTFTKLFSGYIREMTIWFKPSDSFVKNGRKIILKLIKKLENQVNKLNISTKYISPELMVIFRKVGYKYENSNSSR